MGASTAISTYFSDSLRASGFSEAILMFDERPLSEDGVCRLARESDQLTVALHAIRGGWIGTSRSTTLLDAPPPIDRELTPDDFAKFALRQRGIFKARNDSSNPYAFYYSIPLQEHLAEVTARIEKYLHAEGVSAVILDSGATGEWFKSCVVTACSRSGTIFADASVVPSRGRTHLRQNEFEEMLRRQRATAAVAVPAFRTGVMAGRVAHWLECLTKRPPLILTVFFDPDERPVKDSWSTSNLLRRHESVRLADGTHRDVDFFVRAKLESVEPSDWRSKAAALMEQPRLATSSEVAIDDIGAWSFLASCGAATERSVPAARDALRHYPDLHNMDDWDAQWLSTLATDLASERLDALPAEMIFVLPKEETPNGASSCTPVSATRWKSSHHGHAKYLRA